MNRLTYYLCVSLPLTSIAFFSIGFAQFTLFNGLFLILILYVSANAAHRKVTGYSLPISLIILALYLLISNLFISRDFKFTSLIYSIVIIIELMFMSNIARKLETDDMKRISKTIISLFFISITIESLFIFLNIVPRGILADVFPIYYYYDQTRPMGLSSEPSYAAMTLVFTFYILLRSDNFAFNGKEARWYFFTIIAVVLTGSSFGYALLSLLVAYWAIKGRILFLTFRYLLLNPILGFLVVAAIISSVVFLVFNLENNRAFDRLADIYRILSETGLTLSGLIRVSTNDGSAGIRILPTIELIKYFSYADLQFILFGKGAGQATLFYSAMYGQLTLLGLIPTFIFNYGIVGFVLCLACLMVFFPKKGKMLTPIFFLCLLNADFNTQIFVYMMFAAMLSKQMEKNNRGNLRESDMKLVP